MRPGQIVAGKYRVESILGRGGMGVVVSATHLVLDRPVAIKFLKPEACHNPTAVARMLREARTLTRMESEHVARVLDCGVEADTPFLVMELLQGRSLARELSLRGRLPVDEACGYLLQACDAVGEAHALGVVHRDLKPGNLFLARRRAGKLVVKVLDFGLSKVLGHEPRLHETSLTDAHSVLGTPLYVSPEQLRSSKQVDARTDVWSLGLILYQLVTGQTPFSARSIPKLLVSIARDPPPPMRAFDPGLPVELEELVARCLSKQPEDRFANAAELGLALAEFIPGGEVALDRLRGLAGRLSACSLVPPESTPEPGDVGEQAGLAPAQNGRNPGHADPGLGEPRADQWLSTDQEALVGPLGGPGHPRAADTGSSGDIGSSSTTVVERPSLRTSTLRRVVIVVAIITAFIGLALVLLGHWRSRAEPERQPLPDASGARPRAQTLPEQQARLCSSSGGQRSRPLVVVARAEAKPGGHEG